MFRKVFIPTDLSGASMSPAERLGEIPGAREAVFFHARTSALPDTGLLHRMSDALQRQGFVVSTTIAEDDGTPIVERILRAAADAGADLSRWGSGPGPAQTSSPRTSRSPSSGMPGSTS